MRTRHGTTGGTGKFARGVAAACALLWFAGCGKPPRGPVPMLSEKDKSYVRATLAGIKDEVRIVLFSRDGGECRFCGEAEGLAAEIAAVEPRVKLEVLSLKQDAARAKQLGIDKTPGFALLGKKDYDLRYFGLPSGYDFVPFVETIRAVGDDQPGISPESVAALSKLSKPVQLTVFVTQS